MSIKYFSAGVLEYKQNEKQQISRVLQKIHDTFTKSDEDVYIILDIVIGKFQYDLIFIKNNAIVCVEFKNYEGDIIGKENSHWFIITDNGDKININDGKNVFRQARNQRFELINFVNDKLDRFKSNPIKHISAIVCFKGDSTYNYDQIEREKHLWFAVVNETTIVDFLKTVHSNEFYLKNSEIMTLISELGVTNFDISTFINSSREEQNSKSKPNGHHYEDISLIDIDKATTEELEQVIFTLFPDGKNTTTLEEISKKIDPESAVQLLSSLKEIGLIETTSSGVIKLTEDWKDIVYEQLDSAISTSHQNLFYKTSFWLMPSNSTEGEEYLGVYRGTKYHFNSSGNFWWELNGTNIKLEFEFTDDTIKRKILNIKPLGGSFRITENGEILTKIEDNGEFIPIFITKLTGKIVFKENKIKWNPKGLKPGDLWPSIYDGAIFGVNDNRKLFIKVNNRKCYAEEGHEEIVDAVLSFRPEGGRIRITENGEILTLMYSVPYPKEIRKQLSKLSDFEKNLIDIRQQTDRDGMVPVYLGKFSGNIKFKPPIDLDREWSEEDDREFLSRIGAL